MIATLIKQDVTLNRPIAIGTAILGKTHLNSRHLFLPFPSSERSKSVMYSFLYECLYTFFGRKGCIPLYTGKVNVIIECEGFTSILSDTDSLVVKVYSSDIQTDLKKLADMPVLDTCRLTMGRGGHIKASILTFCLFSANYPPDSLLHSNEHAKKLFFFKNEMPVSKPLLFGSLKAKSYFMLTQESLKDIKERILNVGKVAEMEDDCKHLSRVSNLRDSLVKKWVHLASSKIIYIIHGFFSKGVVRSLASELGPVQYIAAMLAGCTISADFRKLQSVAGIYLKN